MNTQEPLTPPPLSWHPIAVFLSRVRISIAAFHNTVGNLCPRTSLLEKLKGPRWQPAIFTLFVLEAYKDDMH